MYLHVIVGRVQGTLYLFKVFDGPDDTAPVLGKFGYETGPDVVSTGPVLFVLFTSDSTFAAEGFQLHYSCE